jgi:hypothetical protein
MVIRKYLFYWKSLKLIARRTEAEGTQPKADV